MELQTFFDNFEVMAEAPNGVTELREAILKLACTGKLVPQQSEEGTSVELIERIAKRLSQVRKGKNRRLPTEEIEDSKGVPLGWTRAYLGEIVDFQYGKGLAKKERDDNGLIPVYGSNGIVGRHSDALISEPALVIGRKGSCGAVNLAPDPFWPIDTTYFVIPDEGLEIRFLYLLIRSLNLGELDKSTAIPGLNRNDAYLKIVDIPPTAEQKRIVAKVDQLMALCDDLEEKKEKRNKYRVRANEASLDKLLNAQEPEEFEENWQRVVENFDDFLTTADGAERISNAVFQLAITGHFTSRERFELKSAMGSGDSDSSLLVPETWEVHTVDNVYQLIDGDRGKNYPKKGDYLPEGHCLFLSTKNVRPFGFLFDEVVFISEEKHRILRNGTLSRGDVVITTRGTLGNVAIYDESVPYSVVRINSGMLIMRPKIEGILSGFLKCFIASPVFGRQLATKRTGSAQPQIPAGILKKFLVPVPPENEQRLILKRLEMFTSQIAQFRESIHRGNQTAEIYSSAIVSRI